jgi:hypothetical protein
MINITAYSPVDLIKMLKMMKKQGRLTELEERVFSALIARYSFLDEKLKEVK